MRFEVIKNAEHAGNERVIHIRDNHSGIHSADTESLARRVVGKYDPDALYLDLEGVYVADNLAYERPSMHYIFRARH